MPIKIAAFAGSTRTQSYNKILIKNAAQMAEQQGAEVTCIDLRDYPLPLYDGDLEEQDGIPENALKIRNLLRENHGILISCPEYNSAISAVLKNMIDWVSRPIPGDPPLVAFSGKTAALLAATPGSLAGIRTLVSVRTILGNIGMIVIPSNTDWAMPHKHLTKTDCCLTRLPEIRCRESFANWLRSLPVFISHPLDLKHRNDSNRLR